MKAASGPARWRGTSVRPTIHGRSSGRRSPSSAATAHSGQSMQRRRRRIPRRSRRRAAVVDRPPRDGPDAPEPARAHLEQLGVAQPGDRPEERSSRPG